MSLVDPRTGTPRVLAGKCSTCIYLPGNPMRLRPGRVRSMQDESVAGGGVITCHKTLTYGEYPDYGEAICRGFFDAVGPATNYIRVAERLLKLTGADWTFVPDPSKTGGDPMGYQTTTERSCTATVDNLRTAECEFQGDVEVYVFNQADENHARVSWTCPLCAREHVEDL